MELAKPIRYRARWIGVIDAANKTPSVEVIENGSFVVSAQVITEVSKHSKRPFVDLGDVLVVPGFVNAHVHLDLSSFAEPLPVGEGFCDWLRRVVAHRRSDSSDALRCQAIERGVAEVIDGGAALIGDYCSGDHFGAAQSHGLDGIIFEEVIGLKEKRYEETWRSAIALANADSVPGVAIAPHAPYTTARTLYDRCRATSGGAIHSTHWYETAEELDFLASGQGAIRDFLESIQAWEPAWTPSLNPLEDYLGTGRWLLAHGNFLSSRDMDWLATNRDRFAIVYCPRTHDHFRHPPHPWREGMRMGLPVALGTDSRASNPDLSIFNEARWLSGRFPGTDPRTILTMLTVSGSAALGRPIALLKPSSPATVTILRLPNQSSNPLEDLFHPESEVVGVMSRGRLVKGVFEA